MATIKTITEAILALKDRTGSSVIAINKWIESEKKAPIKKHVMKAALKNGVEKGILTQVKNSYKVSPEAKKVAKKKEAPKPKKATSTSTKKAPKKASAAKKKPIKKKPATSTKKKATKSSTKKPIKKSTPSKTGKKVTKKATKKTSSTKAKK